MLLLARAANDAAEPWGFSNFCIVAHPCAGLKKHGDILATTLKKREGLRRAMRKHIRPARKPLAHENARSAYP